VQHPLWGAPESQNLKLQHSPIYHQSINPAMVQLVAIKSPSAHFAFQTKKRFNQLIQEVMLIRLSDRMGH
jgi:hypothetical protein